ncbi:MAG: succinylglutamate desuccinylase/aspartoacylase family protein [Planctomycetota bacterium]
MAPTTEVRHVIVKLQSGEEVKIPYWEIDSGADGPVLFVLSNQHGNEVNGSEAIRRFVEIAKTKLRKGKVFAMPFANILALRKRRPHTNLGPEQPYGDDQGHNMNRTWPGKADGNDTERMSYAIWEGVARHATHIVDLHSWSRFSATGGITKADRPEVRALAEVAAIRFVHVSKPSGKPVPTITGYKNSLGGACYTIELTTQYAVVEHEVERGRRAVLNIAKHLGMIAGKLEGRNEPVIFLDKAKETKIIAETTGLFVEAGLATWDYVEKGQRLGHILNDETLETREIVAPVSGYLKEYGVRRPDCDVALPAQHPYASVGDLLVGIVEPETE